MVVAQECQYECEDILYISGLTSGSVSLGTACGNEDTALYEGGRLDQMADKQMTASIDLNSPSILRETPHLHPHMSAALTHLFLLAKHLSSEFARPFV